MASVPPELGDETLVAPNAAYFPPQGFIMVGPYLPEQTPTIISVDSPVWQTLGRIFQLLSLCFGLHCSKIVGRNGRVTFVPLDRSIARSVVLRPWLFRALNAKGSPPLTVGWWICFTSWCLIRNLRSLCQFSQSHSSRDQSPPPLLVLPQPGSIRGVLGLWFPLYIFDTVENNGGISASGGLRKSCSRPVALEILRN